MMGTVLQRRTLRITSRPSISGRPRSRRTTLGLVDAISAIPSFPLVAVEVTYPWASRIVSIKLQMFFSSSMMIIVDLGSIVFSPIW